MGSELVHSAECDQWQELLFQAIANHGDLSEARFVALEALQDGCDEATLAAHYRQQADELLAQPFSLNDKSNSTRNRRRVQAVVDPAKCWTSTDHDGVNVMLYLWDKCCTQVQEKDDIYKKQKSTSNDVFFKLTSTSSSVLDGSAESNECIVEGKPLCCEFHARTRSYLRLPTIREVALRVRVESEDGIEEVFDLEQDGFLRRFDVAGILWPSGYFLALCVAAPTVCGIPELEVATSNKMAFVLELGTGIGLPSISFARMLARRETDQQRPKFRVVATDKAMHALSLTASNARAANASVTTVLLDHFNKTAIKSTFRGRRFSVILGSALQSMFDESTRDMEHPLWNVLDMLLEDSGLAVILLSHTIHTLQVPVDGKFKRIRIISGNQLGMNTRNGEDFLISVFQRSYDTAFNLNEEL